LADFVLQSAFVISHVTVRGVSIAPGRKITPVAIYQSRADNESEDRAPVIAAAGAWRAFVLG
jgi:hypothetical protein